MNNEQPTGSIQSSQDIALESKINEVTLQVDILRVRLKSTGETLEMLEGTAGWKQTKQAVAERYKKIQFELRIHEAIQAALLELRDTLVK